EEQPLPGGRFGGSELQDNGEVVGQFTVVELEAGGAVGVFEPQQRHAAFSGVAVGEVGQIGAEPFAVVECCHVVGGQLGERGGVEMIEEGVQRGADRRGQRPGGGAQQRPAVQELLVGVADQQGLNLPRGGGHGWLRGGN